VQVLYLRLTEGQEPPWWSPRTARPARRCHESVSIVMKSSEEMLNRRHLVDKSAKETSTRLPPVKTRATSRGTPRER
jgi:hypothetical protein